MFKNLKIGVKIILGFGTVILMTVIIAAVVLVTNLQSIENVSSIQSNADLQTLSFELVQDFLNARVPANKLIYTTDTVIYNDFKSAISGIDGKFDAMYNSISKDPILEKFKPTLQSAQIKVNEWIDIVHQLAAYNEQELIYLEDVVGHGLELATVTDLIMSDQTTMLDEDANGNASKSDLLRRSDRIKQANSISTSIYSFRIKARQILDTYDTELLPETLTQIDTALEQITKYLNDSTLQTQKDNAQRVISSIQDYREALVEFGTVCEKAAEIAVKMPTVNQTAQTELITSFMELDDAIANLIDSTSSSAQNSLLVIIIVVIIALMFAVVMALIIMRGITIPVKAMYKVMRAFGDTGNLKFTEEEKAELASAESMNEIGQSISAFSKMLQRLTFIADCLEKVAKGDLSVTLSAISNDDTMGNALIYMLDNLNEMFGSINEAAEQVNSGAEQVSSASQALAQGATEQASSVEELSASIQEISGQVNENSENAEKASVIADETAAEVQTGNEQMGQMLKAMDDINASSNEISKIIMVIDSIASQTNILALNAAVEAARAGDAGKGFAVVAEEVRNLASKSADAAKQTNDLIANSIQNVNQGAEIAKKTATSLENIETKSKEVNDLITEIANASKEQAQGVSQINIGVEQISSVVQTNSATAEESAAAAEELSSQSNLLTEQIANFTLR